MSTQSPRRILHPPADPEIDKGEERHRYPPRSDVQIPYRPPAEHYGKLQIELNQSEQIVERFKQSFNTK